MRVPEVETALQHPTAIVDPSARIAATARIGPYAVIGPDVEIGERVTIGPHAFVERDTTIGDDCRISKGAVLGTDPQDVKYRGERTFLEVGPRTIIREYATVNRGTAASGRTVIGSDCLLMAYVHVAHDCRIDEHVILANAVNMGGHVQIGSYATIGGVTALHQFVRVGRHSFVGGGSRVTQDVPPYSLVAGNPCALYGMNLVGLRRRGLAADTLRALRHAYRRLFQSRVPLGEALEALEAEEPAHPEVREVLRFLRESARGVTARRAPLRRGDPPGP